MLNERIYQPGTGRAGRRLYYFLAALLLFTGCRRSSGPPFSPAETVRGLQVETGLKVEVYASEPQIASPVDMDIDEYGRIYVAENRGYPLDTEHKLGRI